MDKLIKDEKTGLFTDESISAIEKEGNGFEDLEIDKRVREMLKEQAEKKAKRLQNHKKRAVEFKGFSEEAYKDFAKRQKSGDNEKVMMKKFNKYEVGELVMGVRAGTTNNLRPGKLVYGYFTLNNYWWNCAWVIKSLDDGKLRSYQCLKRIRNANELKRILKLRKSYLKDLDSAFSDKALLVVLLKEKK